MTPAEIDAFLREPRIASLATVRPDGSPHLAPVWHHFDGDSVIVVADHSAVKVRNIRHDPRVTLCIATDRQPYKYVLVEGTATISNDGIPDLVRTMAVHYMGRKEGARYAKRAIEDIRFVTITVTPSKITGWVDKD